MPGSRRQRLVLAAALGAAAACAAWPVAGTASPLQALVSAAGAAASSTYADPTGDSGNAPDVTNVVVATDDAGKFTFTVSVPNRASLSDQDGVQLFLDTDTNSSTGDPGGFEYDVAWLQGHAYLFHWDGSQFASVQATSFSGSSTGATETASVAPSDLGGATTFAFVLTTTGDGGSSIGDRAPDGVARWTWPPSSSSPPPPPTPPPTGSPPPSGSPPPAGLKLAASKLAVGKPHAGRLFTVSMVVRDAASKLTVKTAVSCSLKLAGKPLRVSRKGSLVSGRASCKWLLPRKTQGKALKGTITARYLGAKVSRSFSRRVLK
jgi:hypothetical protein